MRQLFESGRTAAMAAVLVTVPHAAWSQPGPAPAADVEFHTEVTTTHVIVDPTGRITRQLPASRYRLERLAGGRLRMTMLAAGGGAVRGPLADPYAGITVEAEPGGAIRMRDAQGQLVATPGSGQAMAVSEPGAAPAPADDGMVTRVGDRARRLERLGERFGRPSGTVRSLSRYLSKRGRVVEEMLVAPDTGLPVEINRAENGALVEHQTFDYASLGAGQLIRRRSRSESVLPDGRGARLVTTTTLGPVTVTGGGR